MLMHHPRSTWLLDVYLNTKVFHYIMMHSFSFQNGSMKIVFVSEHAHFPTVLLNGCIGNNQKFKISFFF